MLRKIEVCCMAQTADALAAIQETVGKDSALGVSSASGLFRDAIRNLAVFKPDVIVISAGAACPLLKGIIQSAHQTSRSPIIVMGESTQLKVVAELAGIYDYIHTGGDALRRLKAKSELVARIKLAADGKAAAPAARQGAALSAAHAKFRTRFGGVLALGASCGGTEAISEVIKALPPNLPGMAIVQHMPPGFTKMYAQRLDREAAVHVVEAVGLHRMETGKVLLAPGDMQMRVVRKADGFYTECFGGQKVSGHKPSVDVLFNSVAKCAGSRAVGIILTGMGSDGAKGLLEMRRKGAFTIGQDELSSVVYGMPRVAYESGAVQKQVPLRQVAPTLMNYLATAR